MGVYFKVYYKRSQEPIATFNERQIVDFCMSNKESIKKYYFSTGGKELMEWEVFAVRHADLFVQKAKEREEKERQVVQSIEIPAEPSKTPFYVLGGVAAVVVLLIAGALIYHYASRTDSVRRVHDLSAGKAEEAAPAPLPETVYPLKRDPRPGDDQFVGKAPAEKTLTDLWKKSKAKLPTALGPEEIKAEMDKYLPALAECFSQRVAAGDRNLKGTVNMRIRVAGDGTVLDLLFTDEKYKATLFSDCLGEAMKKEKFRLFKSKEQTFTYYYEL